VGGLQSPPTGGPASSAPSQSDCSGVRFPVMGSPYRVCFVCSGNICRSPMAEWVFRHHVREAGLDGLVEVDSAGTGDWHAGEPADQRAVAALRRGGYEYGGHRARQFQRSWFEARDLVVALDRGHLRELRAMAPGPPAAARVRLLRSFDPGADGDLDVPDPYYGGTACFNHCLALIEAACPGLMEEVGRGSAVP
jgi:protein-tyrosine phosphatase